VALAWVLAVVETPVPALGPRAFQESVFLDPEAASASVLAVDDPVFEIATLDTL